MAGQPEKFCAAAFYERSQQALSHIDEVLGTEQVTRDVGGIVLSAEDSGHHPQTSLEEIEVMLADQLNTAPPQLRMPKQPVSYFHGWIFPKAS